ncbi:MAG: PhoH family protein, partial [Verrucomicrobiota bacterium]|nr:PhoH family protein [Verrucomicrobiota bacterium]
MPSETIHFTSARQLSMLYADDERNLEEAEDSLGVSIASRDDWVTVEGKIEPIAKLKAVFELLEAARAQGLRI